MKTSWLLLDASDIDHFAPYDALPISCILIENGTIHSANEHFKSAIGHADNKIIGNPVDDYLKLENGHSVAELIGNNKGAVKNVTARLKVKDKQMPVSLNFNVEQKSDKVRSLVTITELAAVSDSKQSSVLAFSNDEANSKQNTTLIALLNSAQESIYAVNEVYQVIAINPKAIAEFREIYKTDITTGDYLKDLISEEDFLKWKALYDRVLSGESIKEVVERKELKKVYNNNYSPIRNSEGNIVGVLEVSTDISDSVERERALAFSEYQFRTLVEYSPTSLMRISTDGKINYASPQVERDLGYSTEDLQNMDLWKLIVKNDIDHLKNVSKGMSKGVVNHFATVDCLNKQGNIVKVKGNASVLYNDKDEAEEIFLSFVNVTEEYEAQQKLQYTSGQYDSLFENANDAIILYDYEIAKNISCNKMAQELMCMTADEILSAKYKAYIPQFSPFFPSVDQYKILENIALNVAAGKPVVDMVLGLKNKEDQDKVVNLTILKTGENSSIVFLIMSDETSAHKSLKLIEEKTTIYETLINNSFDGIDILKFSKYPDKKLEGQLLMRNDIMHKILGTKDGKLFSRPSELLEIAPEYQRSGKKSEDILSEIVEKVKKLKSFQYPFRFEHENGRFDTIVSLKVIELDSQFFLVRNFRDISDEMNQTKIINDQLQALNVKNEELKVYIESNLQLENFAYIASHDLKAPIRSVISFAQLLKNNTAAIMDEKNARFLDIIISASTNMQVLIDDLLSFSRINTQAIEFEQVDIQKMLKHLLIEIYEPIEKAEAEVKILSLPSEPIVADASRLRQVFQNLITNAIKFFKEGERPVVEIDYTEDDNYYNFTVKDYGIGIEPQYLREIFMMFKKLHSENKYKGTGIGLSICKKIVEQHEGEISATSTLGKGTTFTFSISKGLEVNI